MLGKKILAKKYENLFYVVNTIHDEDGSHSYQLHKNSSSWEKGVLMLIMSFMFCRGELRTENNWRYLKAEHLFRLLNEYDDRLPEEPPRNLAKATNPAIKHDDIEGWDCDLGTLLARFCERDYLIKEKVVSDEDHELGVSYAIGPRAVLEVGRLQILTFIHEASGQEISDELLFEIKGGEEAGEEDSGEEDNRAAM